MKILQLNVLSGKKQVTEIYLVSVSKADSVKQLFTYLLIYFLILFIIWHINIQWDYFLKSQGVINTQAERKNGDLWREEGIGKGWGNS